MHDFEQLENILDEQKVAKEDQQLIRDFFISFGFQKRQQLMGIFVGWPERAGMFIDLIKNKKALAEKFDAEAAREILDLEEKEINSLIKNLQ